MKKKSKYKSKYVVDPMLICSNINYLLNEYYSGIYQNFAFNNYAINVYLSTFGFYFNNQNIRNEQSDMIINLIKTRDLSNFIMAIEQMKNIYYDKLIEDIQNKDGS